jgi:hypothetical protein
MAEPQTLDLLGGQIDVDQVAGALSSLIPQQQAEALPTAGAEPVQMASAEVPVEPVSIEPAVAKEPAVVEPAIVEPVPVKPAAVPQVKIFEYEGTRFNLPADVTQQELEQIIAQHEKTSAYAAKKAQTDKLWERANVDSESGAPALVSMAVGPSGERSDDERLRTLQNYYPDAVLYGENNFIFTDPDTGRFTLYNAPGFDARDVAEYAKIGVEAIGGGFGAAAGFVSGLATGPGAVVTSPTLAVIGAGVGTEVAARIYDVSMGVFARRETAPKTLAQEFAETGIRVGLAATSQAAGPVIAEAGKRALTGVSSTARNAAATLVEKFKSLGIEPVGAAIGRKGMLGRMGAGFEQMAAAGPIMQRQAERVVVQLDDALQKISSAMGEIRTVNEAGAALKASVEAAEKRVRDGFSKKYTEVFDEIGADTIVDDLGNVESALQPLLSQIAQLPIDAQPEGKILSLVKKYDSLVQYARTGNMTFETLRDLRTQLRLIKGSKNKSGTQGDYDNLVENVYKAITDDLSVAANKVNPNLGGKLKAIDTERAIFANTAQKTFDKIKSYDADNQAFDYLMTSSKGMGREGVKALQRLKENFTPEEWGDVSASALYNLGRENVGAQVGDAAEFSTATFMKRLSEIKKNGPEAFEALFGGTQYAEVADDLMKLVDVVGALKEVKRYTAFSNSPGAINQMIFWQALSSAATGLAAGDVLGAAAAIGGTVLAPAFAAKLMTNPAVIQWLSTPASQISKDVASHVARLVAIGQAQPEIQEEIRQYYKAIRSYTGYTNNDTGIPKSGLSVGFPFAENVVSQQTNDTQGTAQ